MKRAIVIYIIIILTGCSRIAIDKQVSDNLYRLNLHGNTRIITKADSLMGEGISIGVYVPFKDSSLLSAKANFSNVQYTSGNSGTLSGGPVLLTVGRSYDIYGYVPYQPGIQSPDSIVGFKIGDDVMVATKSTITDVSNTNSSAVLTFEHLVSQLSFKIIFEDKSIIIDSTTSIEISGFYSSAKLNLTNNTLFPADATSSLTARGTAGSLSVQPFCFYTDKESNMTLKLKITAEGVNYYGEISRLFVPGESYRYTVTVPISTQDLKLNSTLTTWVQIDKEILI